MAPLHNNNVTFEKAPNCASLNLSKVTIAKFQDVFKD